MTSSKQRYLKYILDLPFRFAGHKLCNVKSQHCFYSANPNVNTMSSDAGENNWRGVPLSEMYGSQSPWGAPEFPLVAPSYNHAVLYHIPASGMLDDRPPKPQIGRDKWDQEHVRLPCSSHSLYPVEDSNGESHLKKRWEIIEHALWRPIRNSKELADTILSYNTKFKSTWKFRALHKLFEEYLEEEEAQYFFDVTLPEIAKLALALPKLVQSPIPLLKQTQNKSVSLSQQQIGSLLANAFFCTFPRRNTTKSSSEYYTYPFINFNRLYETSGPDHVLEKLKCICHYFRRVCTKAGVGVLSFSRRAAARRARPGWARAHTPLAALPLHVDPDGTIEDAHGLIQVDFANKYLGGGVLNYGCVQEEIRFMICPELLISMLFTEVLRPNEALLIIGCERYSSYSGYGQSFQWTGDHADAAPRDSSHRRRCAVLAVDALPYNDAADEFRPGNISRELDKAWIGFSFATDPASTSLNYPGIATGNWGCGAFGGSPQLKSLLQMMACAAARRPMAYYTFRDNHIRDDVIGIYNFLVNHNVTIAQLYQYITNFSKNHALFPDLHAYLRRVIKEDNKKTQNPNDSSNSAGVTSNQPGVKSNHAGSMSDHKEVTDNPGGVQNNPVGVTGKPFGVTSDQSAVDEKLPSDESSFDRSNELERMDISMISDTSLHDITSTSGLHQTRDSPDLFASQEEDESLTEIKIQKDIQTPIKRKIENTDSKPSKLIEEMQKLDEQSGRLNLSVPSTSPFRLDNGQGNDANTAMDSNDAKPSDPTAELKKRVSRKITDYFSKKP